MSNDGAITIVGNQNTTVTDGNSSLIIAGNGNDVLVAGTNSIVTAGNGSDTITVGAGSVLVVGSGNDTITDGANSAVVIGDGNDVVTVGAGSAVVIGNGNDTITLGANSVLVAGNGSDTIYMGASDTVAAGSGKDIYAVQNDAPVSLTTPATVSVKEDGSIALAISAGTSGFGFGNEVIVGFGTTTDKVEFSTAQFANFAAVMAAAKQVGSDTIITGDSGDTIDLVGVKLSSLTSSDFLFTSPPAVTVTISGIPTGVTLSDTAGALTVTNGSVTLTQAQLAGLTLKASEVTTATLTVTAFDPANGTSVVNTIALSVTPVAPTLTLTKSTLTVNEDGTVALGITETPFDARDTVSIVITGVPSDATLSAGTKNSNGSWTLTPAQLSGLTLKAGEVTSATLTITATNTQGATASTSTTLGLSVLAVAPTLTAPTTLTVNAGATVALGITETPFDSRDTVSIVITGVPSDATLSAGTKNSNGSWTLTPAQLSGLTLKAGAAATATLTVTATNTLGATASASQNIQLKIGATSTLAVTFTGVSFTDTGVTGDGITNNGNVTLSGTVTDSAAISSVKVYNAGSLLGTATVNSTTHAWSLTTTLAQGTYNQLSVTATDASNNSASATTTQSVQVDTTPPAITFATVSFTDTGVQGDHITNNGNVMLSGTVSDNVTVSQVQVFNGTTLLGTATVNNTAHTWSLTTTLAQGTYANLNATATDEAGNTTSATTAQTVQVDTTPPAIAFTTVSFTDTGVQGDHITNNGNVTLSGTTSDNVTVSQVQVFNGTTLLGTATVNNTAHTWTLTTTLAQGTYSSLNATATDEAGNTASATTTQTVQVDTMAPTIAFTTVSFTDTGVTGDSITNNGNVTLSGTTSDNVTVSQVQVFNGTTLLGTATVNNTAHTWTLTTTLAQGTYSSLNAVATDEAGNTASATTTQTVQVDTTAPTIAFTTVSFTDTGVTGDSITNNGNVTLSGMTSDNVTVSQVQVFNGTTLLGTATVNNTAHTWSLNTTLAQGTYANLNATATDEAGNTASAATTQTVQVDTTAPTIAFTTVSFTDTGVTGDGITNNGNVTLSGTTSDNVTVSQVQVFNGTTLLGTATVNNSNHTWSLNTTLAQGTYANFNATATDEAGNTASASTPQTVQVDTAPPVVTFDTVSFVDTGVVGDATTNIGAVYLSGSVSDGVTVSQVQVFNGTTLIGVATVDNVAHTWSLSPALAQGTYNQLSVTATDIAGNTASASTAQSVTVDTTPPAITFDTVSFTDTGVQGDHITNNGHVILSGTVSDNISVAQVQVFNNGVSLGVASVSNGQWTLNTTLAQGTYSSLSVTATDEAGNTTSATTIQTVQVDTAPPSITFNTVSFTDTGVQGDHITNNGNVTLAGTVSDNVSVTQVQVFNNGVSLGYATVSNGQWTFSPVTPLGQGNYNALSVTATDEAGNTASATTTQSFQVDTSAPNVTFDTVSFAATGAPGITDNNAITLSGTTSDNITVSQVQVFEGNQSLGFATVDNTAHTWTLTTNLNDGTYNQLSATATDEAGNTTSSSTAQTVQIDTSAPTVTFQTVSDTPPATGSTASVSADGNVVTMSGTVSDNVAVAQVQIFNAGTSLGYATVSNGTWTFNPALPVGNYNSLSVTATDEAGNTSSASTGQAVNVIQVGATVTDGYIVGATVFADSNGDGILDDGEASGKTDAFGHFVLSGGTTNGTLIMTGGVDSATGLAFTGVLTAPTGSTEVTPLTTLVQSVEAAGLSSTAANAAVANALGLDPSTNLSTLDTVAAAYAGNSQAFVAASSVLNTVSMVASAVAGTGTDFSTAANNAFSSLASQIVSLGGNQTLDLTSTAVVTSTLSSTAAQSNATLTSAQTDGIVSVVTSVNTATNQAAATAAADGSSTATLLTNVSATSIVAQGSASSQLNAATNPTADPSALSSAVSANSGTNLSNSVSQAATTVPASAVAPAPPTVLGLTPVESTPTNATTVQYLLSFSDSVAGITTANIGSIFSLAETGLPGASIAGVTAVAGSNNAQYVISINTGVGDGTLTLSFTPGTTVTDLAGKALLDQSTHTGPTYTIDQGAIEQAALALTVSNSLINAAASTAVQFSIAGLESADTGLVTFTDGTHQVKVIVRGTATNYVANLSTLTDGPITSQLQVNTDAAGNVFTPVAGNTVTLDRDVNQQNVVSISMSGPAITNGVGDLKANSVVTITVNMSQAVTVSGVPTLTLNDGRTISYSGPMSPTAVTALTFTYNVQAGENTADLAVSSINLNGGAITDLAGNNVNLAIAPGVNPASVLQIDTTPPSIVGITQTDPTSTNASVVHYTITFSEAVTGVIAPQFNLVTSGVSGASVASVTAVAGSNGTQYVVAVNTGTGSGTISLNFNGASVADLAGNTLTSTVASGGTYTVAPPPPMLWGTSIINSGDHFYGPSVTSDNGQFNLFVAETASNFNVNGPDAVTQDQESFDPFFLPFRGGNQVVASYNITAFPFSYNEILPVTLIPGSTTNREFDAIGFYVSDDANGNASIDRVISTNPVSVNGGLPTVGTPTVISSVPAGDTVKYVVASFTNTTSTSGLLSTYDVAWDQYNAQTQTYQVEFQSFNADNSAASPVTQLISQTGVTSYNSAEGWFFRAANGTVSTDALLSATHNSTTNSDTLTFQGYNANGTLTSETFTLTPDLSHYAAGATASIVQSTVNPPTRTGSILPVIFTTNPTGGTYSAAWDETVTDSTGTYNQVEFAIFKANSTGVTGSLVKQVTFQVADGLPQQVRVGTYTYLGQSYLVLAYGDTTSSHIVEFDSNGNEIATYSEATNQFFNQLEIFGDGRVGLSYDNVIDSAGDTELTTNIIDLRTSGIPSTYTGIVNASNHDFAGTQFNDTVVGVNNANNEYYFVGRNTTGQGPSDTFSGGTVNSWNAAIFADARSNYTITTVNGVTTITNVGDPAHAGTLTTTNVQELAFAPGVDPTPASSTSNVIADGTVVMLGGDGGNRAFTIDGGATLELATAESGLISFAGPTGTLQLDNASSYSTIDAVTSTAGTFAITGAGNLATTSGDGIDFTSSGGALGTPANLSVTTTGAISASASTATGINVVQNGFGNITIDAAGGASGGTYGIQAINNSDGNISVETAGTVSSGIQYGIYAKTIGAGNVSVVTDAGSVINSGGSGIAANNRDQTIAASANSTVTVTNNATIHAGPTANLSGSASAGILAGYNGNNQSLASIANTNVNGTVVVNNNANVSGGAGYGIDAFNYGNGNVTVNEAAGTNVSGGQYGIAAFEESAGTGNIAINVGANVSITGTTYNALQAFSVDNGSISVTTAAGDVLNSGSSAINANNWSTSASASTSVTVVANGTINSGAGLSSSGSQPSAITAGFFPGGTNQPSNAVAGSVSVTSNAIITAAAGSGINAYNYGTGNVTVTTGATSSITAAAGNGISASSNNGGNVSVTNAGSTTGTTGLFAGETGNGTIFVENDGTVTGTVNSGIAISQNTAASTGSTTITNTGTVTGANNRSAIGVTNDAGTATINNTGTIGSLALLATSSAISENAAGTFVINNSGKLYGAVTSTSNGALGANTTLNNNAGSLWQTSFITDEGTINATGSTINVVGTTTGVVVGNTGSGAFTASAGSTITADFLNIAQSAGSHGTVTLTGMGTTLNTTAGQYQNIELGGDGTGSLTIANHAVATTTNIDVAVNHDAGITDTLDVNNGTLNVGQGLTIGDAGTANATVEGGGVINATNLEIGNQSTGVGSLTVTGAGSVVSVTNLALATGGGSATLNISNGGAVDVGSGTTTIAGALHVGAAAVVGASGTINGNVVDDGNITVTSGTLEITGNLSGAGTTVINSGDTLKLDGSVSDNLYFAASTGTLDVTTSSGFSGTIQGELSVGDVLDFGDINGALAHIVSYTGNNAPGMLTVTDGTHTASINLAGNYSLANFALGTDANGGTTITATPGPATISDGQTLIVSGSSGETVTFLGGTDTLQLAAPASTGTINGVSSASGTFIINGSGNVITTSGDAIDFTSSGGAVGTPANISVTTGGAISASASTATGIDLTQNGFGNITVDATGGVSGGYDGIQALNNSDGNISVETAGTVTGTSQYGVFAKTIGAGNVSVTTDAGSVINSGSSGIVINNRDMSLVASANSTVTVTNNATINAGPTPNLSGSASGGIVAGYNGNNQSLASVANLNVNGTVLINNNANVSGAAGYGVEGYNYGNGNVTVNEAAGTTVSGGQYGIAAFEESAGTGNISIGVGANASITGTTYNAIQAFSVDNGSISVTTAAGDVLNSGSSAINANNWSTSASASTSVTVVANGTIHSGAGLSSSGSQPSAITAGFFPGGTNQPSNAVAGSVSVTSNAIITAAAGSGINTYNYGTGNVTVTTGATSSITASAGNGISASSNNGGNVSVTNAGSLTGTTGLFAGETGSGTIAVENDGTVTGTVNSGINVSQNTAASTGSTTITNTGTVTGAANRSAINITNDAGTVTINNSGTIGSAATASSAPAISENAAGNVIINDDGTIDGAISTSSTGAVGPNTAVSIHAGALWQAGYITDEGAITAAGAGSTITVLGTSTGIVVGNTGTGVFTAAAGASVTANFLNLAQAAGSHGTATITGSATGAQFQNITVGQDGTASLTVSNQTLMITSNVDMAVNHDAGVTDTLDVNDATIIVVGVTVGDGGTANATVENGGIINTNFITIANQASAVGSVTVTGAGSEIETGGIAFGANGGTASLTVSNGGAVEIGGVSLIANAVHVGSSNSLQGTGTINANVVDDGNVTVTSGTLDITGNLSGAGTVTIDQGATLELGGSVSDNISFAGLSGTLDVATSSGFSGTIGGQLAVGDVLDFADINAASAHIVSYTGNNSAGTLTVTDGTHTASIQLSGNYSLANFTLGADANNGTTIVATPTTGSPTISDGQTLVVSGSTGETVTFLGGTDTLQLAAPTSTGTINGVSSASGTFIINGSGNVATTSGDAIDFTSSGGAVGTPANISVTTGGAISASANTATGINVAQNGFGNITVDATDGVSGGDFGIQAVNNSGGNISVETAGTVTGTVQYGVLAKEIGAGNVSVTTDAGSIVNSGGSGIVVNNRDLTLAASANSTITVTNNGTINAGPTANLSGSVSAGIVAGYNGASGLSSAANTNVNGTVVINNNGTINNGAYYGIDAYNYGNGNVTVNDAAGTSVSGMEYGIGAYENSKGTGDVAVNVGANATVSGGTQYAVLAFSVDNGNTSITTSAGDTFTSASSALNASNQATSVSSSSSVTVVANGTIHSGTALNSPSNSQPAGIIAGYNPGAATVPNSAVAGSVFITSNANITADGGAGISGYNFGTGNITITTSATSSVTAAAGNAITANASDGGNVSITNAGSATGTVGIFAGTSLNGTIFVENDGTVTGTVNSSIVATQNTAASTGSTTITNTGTVSGAPANRSAISVNNNLGTATINNTGTIGSVAAMATSGAISENANGTFVINNNSGGVIDGSINSTSTGALGPNTTVNNNAGALWQANYIDDEGTITSSGAGSAITIVGSSNGVDVGDTGTGSLIISGGAALTADFLNIGQGAGGHGAVTVTGAGSSINTSAGQYQNIGVGYNGTGSLTIANQAVVTTTSLDTAVFQQAGVTDTLDVNNATLNVSSGITIGDAGTANATVEGGGVLNTNFLDIGNQATGVGSLTVTGAGSVVSTNGLAFGNSVGASATLNITNGGAVDLGAGTTTIAGALHIGGSGSLQGTGTINGNVVDDGSLTVASGTLDIAGNLSGTGTVTIDAGATLEIGGSAAETINFAGGGTLQLDNAPGFTGTINALTSTSGNFAITGQGSVATSSGDAIDLTSSGGVVGTPAELSVTTGGAISASASTATGINVTQNGVGDIAIHTLGSVSGGNDGIQATNASDSNISVETAGTVTGTVQYGVLAKTTGAGSVTVTNDATGIINSGSSGIVINNRDLVLAASSNSMVTVTNNGTINAGPTANLSGSASGGIVAGYNGASGTASAANTNVNGTVVINNNGTINTGASYGINAYNYGNGNVTVNDAAGTSVAGTQYGISAAQNSKGTGDVSVSIGANATVNAGSLYGVLASSVSDGNISISTSNGDVITSGGTGLNASGQSQTVSVGHNLTVVANGTIHAGANPNQPSGSGSAGILAGFNPNSGAPTATVKGNVSVTSNATITSAGTNGGIDAYNYGTGSVTVTTGATSSVTATAGTGIGGNSFDGGNVRVTNGGTVTGTTGLFGQSNGAGTVYVENDGSVTGTGASNAGMAGTQTSAGSSITLVNTGTVVGPTGRGAIGVNDSATSTVTITNSGTVGTVASSSTTAPAIAVNGGGASILINNTGTLYGSVNTSGSGSVAANTTLNNKAGGLWQTSYITDEGTITATDSTINVASTSSGIVISNTGTAGNFTASAGSTVTAAFFNIAQGVGSHGTATITGPGTTLNTTSGVAQNITVGQDGTASLTISNQAVVTTTNFGMAFDNDAGVTDTLDVNNATLNATAGLSVGNAGTATATVEGGGSMNTAFLSIANQATGVGSLTVTGAGSVVSAASMSFGATGGAATLNITNGGAVDLGTGTSTIAGALHIGSMSGLNGSGTINGNVVDDGNLTVASGQLEITGALSGTGTSLIDNGATLKLGGSVTSQTITFAGSSGTLDIASSSGFNGTIGGQLTTTDVLDFTDMNGATAQILGYTGNNSPGTLTIGDGTHTATIALTGNYSLGNFVLGTDSNGGTTLIDPPIGSDASINSSVALLSNYMASSFPSTGSGQTGTTTPSTQENTTTLTTPHAA